MDKIFVLDKKYFVLDKIILSRTNLILSWTKKICLGRWTGQKLPCITAAEAEVKS